MKHFLRCPTCGQHAERHQITRGALGEHSLQELQRAHVGFGNGTNGGPVIWTRRPMNREELEHVGRALATAVFSIEKLLGALPDVPPPHEVLAEIRDREDAAQIGLAWIREAQEELDRRQRFVADDYERRLRGLPRGERPDGY